MWVPVIKMPHLEMKLLSFPRRESNSWNGNLDVATSYEILQFSKVLGFGQPYYVPLTSRREIFLHALWNLISHKHIHAVLRKITRWTQTPHSCCSYGHANKKGWHRTTIHIEEGIIITIYCRWTTATHVRREIFRHAPVKFHTNKIMSS